MVITKEAIKKELARRIGGNLEYLKKNLVPAIREAIERGFYESAYRLSESMLWYSDRIVDDAHELHELTRLPRLRR